MIVVVSHMFVFFVVCSHGSYDLPVFVVFCCIKFVCKSYALLVAIYALLVVVNICSPVLVSS